MAASSLNHVFRLVWSERLGAFVAVAETRRGRGKGSGRNGRALRRALHGLALMLAGLATFGPALAGALPTGAQVVTGNASFAQTGSALTITQKSNLLATNWQSFNIGAGSSVTFVQPSQASVALNRVLGADVSTIQGALKANGQVFLLNPNGVLFTPTAQVNVGGLVASTLAISDADFAAGRFQFHAADSAVPGATVNNQGSLRAADGGTVALIAARVLNSGSIEATRGRALLAAADEVTLDLGASVPLRVTKGALDALVDNGGAIRADGGLVLLTAQARDQLSAAVINNSGVVRAQTLASGEKGEILLLGDMQSGQLNVGGHLDASAPQGGNGGHIETSAAWVNTRADLKVDAAASKGLGGDWLIDPYDYTIGPSAASTISSTLSGGTSVTVTTQANSSAYGSAGSSSGNGDITVSNAITKSGGGSATLTLQADRNIVVNAPITSTSGALNITLSAANNASGTLGGVNLGADLNSNGGTILIGGAGGSLTSAQSNGIGYALNSSASTPAVQIGTNVNILSGGGNITVNGQTNASTSSYEGSKGGIYVLSGATVNSGGGNLYMSGISTGAAKEFGFGVEAASGTTTTFMSSAASGGVVVDAQNTLNSLGALGLVNNGSQARVQFWAPNVAYLQFRINGSNQAATFTQSSPCHPGYPNCGTMVIPGGNQSYTSAGYNVVSMALQPIYVFTGNGSKTYDGTTDASNVALSSLGGPGGFTVSQLGALGFSTASKNAGSYTSLIGSASNPSSYSGGTYAVAYFNQGTYTINQKALNSFSAANKVYDGTTAAAVSASGIVVGDAVTVNATGGFASANVGNGISVNVTGVSLAGADAGNYNITGFSSISTSANITKAALTVTANNAAKTYNGSAWSGNSGVSISGFVNGETSTVLGGSLSYTGSAQGAVNAGSYAITPQGLSSGNYQISYGNGTLTVSPATLSLSANSASRLYGASNPAFSGTVTGFVGSDTLANATTGTLAFSSPATATSNVGSYAINGSGLTANNGNYVFAQAAGNASALSITPATLTVTANSASRLYGAANPSFSGTVSGFVNSDTLANATTGTLAFATPATTASNVGSYAINGSGLTANNGNYVFAQAAGNTSALSITPATLTVVADAASRLYGAANPSLSGTVTGFVNGDTLANATTGTLAFATPATATSNVGGYAINGSGLTANNGNYVFAQAAGNASALTVTPATLTVTANGATRLYGAANPSFSGTVTGFVGGDTLANATAGTLAFATPATATSNVGSYAINGSGLTANNGNYVFAQAAGNTSALSITPATLTVAANSASRLYGAANPSFSGTVTGFVGSDTLANATTGTLAFATPATTASNVGSYAINGSGLTANNGNYVFTQAAGNTSALSVTPATLTVVADAASRLYGAANPSLSGTVTGFVNGDTLANATTGTLAFATPATTASNVGSYAINGSGLSANNGNYVFTQAAGNTSALSVTPATLTVAADPASRLYGAANPSFSGSVSGFVGSDTLANATTGTLAFATPATATSNVGNYAVNGSGLTANNGNYVFAQAAGNTTALTVTPATLTLTAANASRLYGASNPAATGTVTGFVNGDTLANATTGTLAFSSPATATSNVGSYALNGGGLTANHGNYVFVQSAGNANALAVTPAPLTVTANNDSKVYSGNAYGGGNGVSVSGFVNGESAGVLGGTLSFGGSSQGAVNAGRYTITPQGLTAGNYALSFVDGTLNITQAGLTLITGTLTGSTSKVYDGTTTALLAPQNFLLSGFAAGEGATVTQTIGRYADANAGANKWVTVALNNSDFAATGSTNLANYTLPSSVSGSIGSITPAALTVAANNASKTYNAQAWNGGAGVSFSGLVNGESAAVLGGTLGFGGSAQGAVNAGRYTITPQGLSSGNYAIHYVDGSLTVNPAALTLSATPATRTYNGTTLSSATPTVAGLQGNDTVGGLTQAYVDKNAGSGKTMLVTGYTVNDGNGGANYTVSTVADASSSITRAVASVSVAPASTVYNGAVQSQAPASTSGFLAGDHIVVDGLASGRNAGRYASNLSVSGRDAGNYELHLANAELTINPATLMLTATTGSRGYGAANPGFGGSVSGFVGGDTLASATSGQLSFGSGASATSPVGSYAVSGGGLVANHGNYVFAQASGNATALSITPAPLLVSAGNASKTYDAQAWTGGAGVSFSGFVNNESAAVLGGTLSYGGSAQGAVDAGRYTLQPQGLSSTNYAIRYAPGTLSVTPATLSYVAGSASRIYGANNPVLIGTVSGFVGGDTLASATTGALSFASPATPTSAVGSYAVSGGGLSANKGNYVFVQAPGNELALSVTSAPSSGQELVPKPVSVPAFTDNAVPALARETGGSGYGTLNYIPLTPGTPAVSAAPSGSAITLSAAPTAAVAGAGANASTSAGAGTSGIPAAAPAAAGDASILVYTTPGTGPVASSAEVGAKVENSTGKNGKNKVLNPAVVVPSANGPLDVFVIEGGINIGAPPSAVATAATK